MAENTSWVSATDAQRLGDELVEWFMERAGKEARLVSPKAIEYGSRSMVSQGRGLAELAGVAGISDQDAFELAVWDMVRLKVGRWTEAVMHGKPVSDDTLLDIGIYVKMAQRNRDAGSWPGVEGPRDDEIVTPFRMENGIPRVIPAEEEDDDHNTFEINPDWCLNRRGDVSNERTSIAVQWDLVRKADKHTRLQLVQDIGPDGRYYYQANPDPKCVGYHANGYCLRKPTDFPNIHPPIDPDIRQETK